MAIKSLEERFKDPAGYRIDYLQRDGYQLRFGFVRPDNAHSLILIAPGLKEFIEKYNETTRDLVQAGFAVATLDWRGHGGSERYLKNSMKRHSYGYGHDIEDFKAFAEHVKSLPEAEGLTCHVLAHSMGGNIIAHTLTRYPEIAEKAVFSAPMFGIQLPPIIKQTAPLIAKTMTIIGLSEWYGPGQSNWSERSERLKQFLLSSDPVRKEIQTYWFLKHPELQQGGVTWGWLRESLLSCQNLKPQQFKTPSIIALAQKDRIVCNQAIRNFVEMCGADIELIELEDCRHEVLIERDDIRTPFIHRAVKFLSPAV